MKFLNRPVKADIPALRHQVADPVRLGWFCKTSCCWLHPVCHWLPSACAHGLAAESPPSPVESSCFWWPYLLATVRLLLLPRISMALNSAPLPRQIQLYCCLEPTRKLEQTDQVNTITLRVSNLCAIQQLDNKTHEKTTSINIQWNENVEIEPSSAHWSGPEKMIKTIQMQPSQQSQTHCETNTWSRKLANFCFLRQTPPTIGETRSVEQQPDTRSVSRITNLFTTVATQLVPNYTHRHPPPTVPISTTQKTASINNNPPEHSCNAPWWIPTTTPPQHQNLPLESDCTTTILPQCQHFLNLRLCEHALQPRWWSVMRCVPS